MEEDLHVSEDTAFADLLKREIVKALVKDRATDPEGGKTVGPQAGDKTLYRLGYGDDHRGATWFDRKHNVVWLCAYSLHRSGDPNDAFPYFDELIAAQRIRPQEDDYEALFLERDERFADLVYGDAQTLLAEARRNPGEERSGIVGGGRQWVSGLDRFGEGDICRVVDGKRTPTVRRSRRPVEVLLTAKAREEILHRRYGRQARTVAKPAAACSEATRAGRC
jgi:hypothetical protein